MADKHSDLIHDEIESSASSMLDSFMSSGLKSTNKNEYDPSIVAKNLKLAWAGDFHSVKSMVAEYLELDGTWVSPGGEKKVFYVADSPVVIWWSKKKHIQIEGDEGMSLKRKLLSTSMINCENVGGETVKSCLSETSNANSNDMLSSTKVGNCTCNCSGGILVADVEGLKLDMAILEKRLNLLNSCNTMNSELVSLRNKQYDLEATIRKQEETIHKLNDDNAFFKAKLMSFVKQTPIPTYSNRKNKRNGLLETTSTKRAKTSELNNKHDPANTEMLLLTSLDNVNENFWHDNNDDNECNGGLTINSNKQDNNQTETILAPTVSVHPSDKLDETAYAKITTCPPNLKNKTVIKENKQNMPNENVHLPNASVVKQKQKRVGGLPLVEMSHILECKLNSSNKNVVNHNKAKAEVRNTNNQTRPRAYTICESPGNSQPSENQNKNFHRNFRTRPPRVRGRLVHRSTRLQNNKTQNLSLPWLVQNRNQDWIEYLALVNRFLNH